MKRGEHIVANEVYLPLIKGLIADMEAMRQDEHTWVEPIYMGRNKLYRIRKGEESFVVKHFASLGFLKSVYYTHLSPSKAERSHRYALELRNRGVATPESIGYILRYDAWGLVRESYYVCRDVGRKACDLQAHARAWASPEGFMEALADYLLSVHRVGVEHLDLSPGNILYEPQRVEGEEVYDFRLIDLNRMKLHDAPLSRRQVLANLARLMNTRSVTRRLAYDYALAASWEPDSFVAELEKVCDTFWRKRWLKLSYRYAKRHLGVGAWTFLYQLCRYYFALMRGRKDEAERLYHRYLQREDIRHIERSKRGFSYRYE